MKKIYSIVFWMPFFISAQNVALDTNFGNAGYAFNSPRSEITNTILTTQGSIISCGYYLENVPGLVYNTVIGKYNTDGSPDQTFGTNGIVSLMLGFKNEPFAILQQPDGKIVVGGSFTVENFSAFQTFMARFNADGSPDASFGTNGVRTFLAGDSAIAIPGHFTALGLLPDGQILALDLIGTSSNLFRINTDGSPDLTFGVNGSVNLLLQDFEFAANDMMILHDGNVLLWGSDNSNQDNNQLAVVKLHPDGTFFTEFGDSGIVRYNFYDYENWEGFEYLSSGAELADGSLVLNGAAPYESPLIKLLPDGSFDDSFGTNGILSHNNPNFKLAVQADQKILLAGTQPVSGNDRIYSFLRYNTNGTLDTSFNTTGNFEINPPSNSENIKRIILQDDGNLIISAASTFENIFQFFHFRLLLDGNLDTPTFASDEAIQVFPNPFEETILFNCDYGTLSKITLIDAAGKIIFEAQPEAINYELRIDLPAGIYFAQISDFNGKVHVSKLIRK
jgi:uncharacterized delta-60 repeat protein